jgi:hypothetical protein
MRSQIPEDAVNQKGDHRNQEREPKSNEDKGTNVGISRFMTSRALL